MKQISYNREISIMHLQLMDVLNSIEVQVFDQISGQLVPNTGKMKQVPVVYAGRSRAAKHQLNFQKYLNGPWISLEYSGFTRDAERASRINQGIREYLVNPTIIDQTSSQNSSDIVYEYDADPLIGYDIRKNPPVPIKMTYKVSVLTQYQSETDQIVQNIIANMNPYLVISWKNPRAQISSSSWDKEILTKAIWDGNSSQTQSTIETVNEDVERIITELGFEVETWIFPGQGPLPLAVSSGYIEVLSTNGEQLSITENQYQLDERLLSPFLEGDGLKKIKVDIFPSCAVNEGAAWRLSTDPEGKWRLPNLEINIKIPENAMVQFRQIRNWQQPADLEPSANIKVFYNGILN